jgi:DUF1680 family protein
MANITPLTPVSYRNVSFSDGFWANRIEKNRKVTLPIEYRALETTGRIDAWKLKWKKGDPEPHIFWDSDSAKWIEAAAYCLGAHANLKLEKQVDAVIDLIERAQKPDGYLNIYFTTVAKGKRWTNLAFAHELYCAGHLMEAAVAYFEATGKRKLLDVMCRYTDYIDSVFGAEKGKIRGYSGHPEIELALVKLYRTTGELRYLKLAEFFVNERGVQPNYFKKENENERRGMYLPQILERIQNIQAHKPVREQKTAEGHSVRACYLYSGMVDVAIETQDSSLLKACRRLWDNLTERRMYVTGGIGSSRHLEEFTFDYDLPNEEAYAETCAAISLVFFAHRMLQVEKESKYADVMELALYNGVISGVSQDGKRFFYDNRLMVHPERVKFGGQKPLERQKWFGCACCPPNIARLLASLGQYIYSVSKKSVYVHLYAAGEAKVDVSGKAITLKQQTNYPWEGSVVLTIDPEAEAIFEMALRLPAWCQKASVKVNGKRFVVKGNVKKGYLRISRSWKKGDQVELDLEMPIERIESHPTVRHNCGMIALKRGPLVYCIEEVDNGADIADLRLPRKSRFYLVPKKILDEKVPFVTATGYRREKTGWTGKLYEPIQTPLREVRIKAVPYFLWNNRGNGEMRVWITDSR